MKNIIKTVAAILVGTSLVFTSCKKDETPIIPSSPSTFGYTIESSVAIRVVDESNNPVSGAQVSIGTASGTTNQDGILLLNGIQMAKERAFVKVTKPNYFFGSRVFKPQKKSTEHVTIKLLGKTTSGTFNSNTKDSVTSTNGVKLVFPANSIKYETGGAYSGTVNVAIKHLNPTATDLAEIMPGDLTGKDNSGELKFLETYGMAAIELSSPSGEKLNLSKNAKLSMPAPTTLGTLPSSMPLWYFDKTEGIWKEEGSATLVGGNYEGEVSHFSFWNCDVGIPRILLNGRVICNGVSLQNIKVELVRPSAFNQVARSSYTNNSGQFSGMVPANETFILNLYSNQCGSSSPPYYTTTIGPFSTTTTLPNIIACPTTANIGTITGKIIDCNGNPVTNGALNITMSASPNPLYFYPNANGDIYGVINYCSSTTTVSMVAYDFTNNKLSTSQNIAVGSTMNFTSIQACAISNDFINYNLDGTNYSILDIPGSFFLVKDTANKTFIEVSNNGGSGLVLSVQGNTVGSFSVISNYLIVNSIYCKPGGASVTTTFGTYGTTTGSKITGTFTGTFIDVSNVSHTLSGSFRLTKP